MAMSVRLLEQIINGALMKALIAVMSLVYLTAFPALALDKIDLKPGMQIEVGKNNQPIVRAAIGDPEVASVSATGKSKLLVSGKAVGETTLLIWYRNNDANPVSHSVIVSPKTVSRSGVQIQTDIKVVEISRTALKEAGFFFGKRTGNTTVGVGNSAALSGANFGGDLFSNNNFMPFSDAFNVVVGNASKGVLGAISALDANGFAYTLAEPSLVTLSGHNATFLAGGEFPYPKSSKDGEISVEFKEFGIRLNIAPTVMDDQRIQLKVAPEVSELNYNQGVTSAGVVVPGVSVRRTDTTIQLGDGESFVISGLISSNTMKSSDRFPGLGDLPIIGAFFRSNRLDKTDKELMMVVTPHIVKPLAKGAQLPALPGEVYRRYNPSFFDLIFKDAEPKLLPSDIGFSKGM